MKTETQAAFDNILNCFAASDGGVSLVNVKALIEEMDKRSEDISQEGHAAHQVIRVVHQFSRLIDFANGNR